MDDADGRADLLLEFISFNEKNGVEGKATYREHTQGDFYPEFYSFRPFFFILTLWLSKKTHSRQITRYLVSTSFQFKNIPGLAVVVVVVVVAEGSTVHFLSPVPSAVHSKPVQHNPTLLAQVDPA